MSVLVDTCVIIDFLRRRPAAIGFIAGLGPLPAVSVVSLAELRAGQRGSSEIALIDSLIANSSLLPVDRDIAERAGEFMLLYRRSHALDMADALIAATADRHRLALATLNLKHFPMFQHLEAAY